LGTSLFAGEPPGLVPSYYYLLHLLMAKELFLLDGVEFFLLLSLLKLALYAGCVEEGEYTSCTGKMFLNIAVVFL